MKSLRLRLGRIRVPLDLGLCGNVAVGLLLDVASHLLEVFLELNVHLLELVICHGCLLLKSVKLCCFCSDRFLV